MKEFQYKNGGRRLYNEDIARLQELALSITSIFKGCDLNFVVSGCEVQRNLSAGYESRIDITVSTGFVWLNGKLREVAERTIENAPSSYIPVILASDVKNDSMIRYANGSTGPCYYDYGAVVNVGDVSDYSSDSAIIYDATTRKFPNLYDFFALYCIGINDEDWQDLKHGAVTMAGGTIAPEALLRFGAMMYDGGPNHVNRIVDITNEYISLSAEKHTTIDKDGITTTGDVNVSGKLKAGELECDSIVIHEEEDDGNGNKTTRDWKWHLNDLIGINDKYTELKEAFDTLNTAVDVQAGDHTVTLADKLAEISDGITALDRQINGSDSQTGIVSRFESTIATILAENEALRTSVAQITAVNTQLRESNISLQTSIQNLNTNYANQLSSVQALQTRVDSFSRIVGVSEQPTTG